MRKKFERSRGDLKQRTVDVHMLQVKLFGNIICSFVIINIFPPPMTPSSPALTGQGCSAVW